MYRSKEDAEWNGAGQASRVAADGSEGETGAGRSSDRSEVFEGAGGEGRGSSEAKSCERAGWHCIRKEKKDGLEGGCGRKRDEGMGFEAGSTLA